MANMLGQTTLEEQFEELRHTFWETARYTGGESPLRTTVQRSGLTPKRCLFGRGMASRAGWEAYWKSWNGCGNIRSALKRWRVDRRRELIARKGDEFLLTRKIPMHRRLRRHHRLADVVLGAGAKDQPVLLRYRLGLFCFSRICLCGVKMHRGHEECKALGLDTKITNAERRLFNIEKARVKGGLFTEVDWLLNKGCTERVADALRAVERKVARARSE